MSKAEKAVCVAIAVIALVGLPCAKLCDLQGERHKGEAPEVLEASDAIMASPEDMQLPELPTGCEATAIATLLRLNGVDVSKTDVANAMPKSDTDFVHSFLGDPYSETGGCCMSICAVETMRTFLVGSSLLGYQTEGRDLADLPTPCVVWVTIGLAEPQGPIDTQGAYKMYYPSHCMTMLGMAGNTVRVIDPLEGLVDYPMDKFTRVYETLGAQAIYIAKE